MKLGKHFYENSSIYNEKRNLLAQDDLNNLIESGLFSERIQASLILGMKALEDQRKLVNKGLL